VELLTDAVNDYFKRPNSPGRLTLKPAELCEHSVLWNGVFSTQWRPPADAKPGETVTVRIEVDDDHKASTQRPFVSEFTLKFTEPEAKHEKQNGGKHTPRKTTEKEREESNLSLPNVIEVHEADWLKHGFTATTGLRIKHAAKPEDGYDFLLNVDNASLQHQIAKARPGDAELVRYWYKWGMALCAMGMMQQVPERSDDKDDKDDEESDKLRLSLETIGLHSDGLARVIVPVIRTLKTGPLALAA
jgi:hypothetical protein